MVIVIQLADLAAATRLCEAPRCSEERSGVAGSVGATLNIAVMKHYLFPLSQRRIGENIQDQGFDIYEDFTLIASRQIELG